MAKYFKEEGEGKEGFAQGDKIIPWSIIETFKGSQLNGLRYEQLMPFEANAPKNIEGDPFKIVVGDFVTTEDGTGIVHTSPAFGADDYKVGQKNNLGILTLVDREGKFIQGVGEFSGRYVKNYKDEKDFQDVNVDISITLKKKIKHLRLKNTNIIIRIVGEQISQFYIIH